jgi:hypothetical protein
MQTFLIDFDMDKNAKSLDNKRLGKQRLESLQIASCLLEKETRWKNHPAVKMWKGYENYLMMEYISAIFSEWENKGFKNEKCKIWYDRLMFFINNQIFIFIKKPDWLTEEFIESHRSNLIRKNKEFYRPLFPNTKEGLEYIWPV